MLLKFRDEPIINLDSVCYIEIGSAQITFHFVDGFAKTWNFGSPEEVKDVESKIMREYGKVIEL